MSSEREGTVRNSFAKGPEGWCSYDYHAAILSGWRETFILSTWRPRHGPKQANCVTVDHHQWSADTPEQPVSIQALIHYRNWTDLEPLDLRGADLSVYLRGDELKTDGAACYFWVNTTMNRWHLTSQPLRIGTGSTATDCNRHSQQSSASDRWRIFRSRSSCVRIPRSLGSRPRSSQDRRAGGRGSVSAALASAIAGGMRILRGGWPVTASRECGTPLSAQPLSRTVWPSG